MSNDFEPNLRHVAWGISLAMVGGLLHYGYRTHSIGSMLGASLLVLALAILLAVWMTARNLRRLNRELRDEEAIAALEAIQAEEKAAREGKTQANSEPTAPQKAA